MFGISSMAGSFGSAALGRSLPQPDAFASMTVPLVVLLLSIMLMATSTLRRALERTCNGKYSHWRGLSGFVLLRQRLEVSSASPSGSQSKRARRRKQKRQQAAESAVPALELQAPATKQPHPTKLLAVVPQGQVEQNGSTHEKDIESQEQVQEDVCCATAAAEQPADVAIEPAAAEEKAQEDVCCATAAAEQPADVAIEPAPIAAEEKAIDDGVCNECSCSHEGAWGCECHNVYFKGLLLAHRAINLRVAKGPPGLEPPAEAMNEVTMLSTAPAPAPAPRASRAYQRRVGEQIRS